ncbi:MULTISPECIES: hypothetical protein [Bacillus cereus group]|jgi:hypothetical protein|uniref:hypothetical protein n=1 Tax=Bacillus cereus group TaxID=86661 RepID=UPI001879B3E6|nr:MULTISPECIES: hypothetical protein [Bacillus cereus group]MBE7118463.1 hypothetical protein [Bacillus cereus]MBE7150314.1 hypothetical protein [Bacillus mycoides]
MNFEFKKVQCIEDSNIYRVNNFTDIYETDLNNNDDFNIDNLNLLFQQRIHQFIIHVGKSEILHFKEEVDSKNIFYKMLDFGGNNVFFVFESIKKKEVLYIIKLFCSVTIENNLAIVCFGEKVGVEFEKVNQNKIIEYVMGSCLVPKITLVPSSACAFIQYDGALLTIVSNNLEI